MGHVMSDRRRFILSFMFWIALLMIVGVI